MVRWSGLGARNLEVRLIQQQEEEGEYPVAPPFSRERGVRSCGQIYRGSSKARTKESIAVRRSPPNLTRKLAVLLAGLYPLDRVDLSFLCLSLLSLGKNDSEVASLTSGHACGWYDSYSAALLSVDQGNRPSHESRASKQADQTSRGAMANGFLRARSSSNSLRCSVTSRRHKRVGAGRHTEDTLSSLHGERFAYQREEGIGWREVKESKQTACERDSWSFLFIGQHSSESTPAKRIGLGHTDSANYLHCQSMPSNVIRTEGDDIKFSTL
ncbi:hypothetical protein SODALDRAFT_164422 [Sodiomyces alkalinus F11]|uniref:Uncharacterized protein n=1 Tax=Sodiomyces alkalinus (strain CBS 110278 / VKM F-3762 / F11) TaxID=1314773 RepID=A0A3N2PVK0_SODAK|nr:hypothetical protein SODALDRAFT_164422 [Sodiomyces alkalinus F11]ROT38533.1 hypothetical protein SODALDRAFT_164422 [Sodiomyces alkalinus F11]